MSLGPEARRGEARLRARAELLALVERAHGIGVRGGAAPGWLSARVDRALDALSTRTEGDLFAAVEALRSNPVELAALADVLRVGETRFFRDPAQWRALATGVVPRVVEGGSPRALSAGCSSGEEAWTLAMLLDAACRPARTDGWRVVGLDRSPLAVATARAGVYPADAVRDLPDALSSRYLSAAGDELSVVERLRGRTSFVERDLLVGLPPGRWDIIVCRNVLIYLGEEAGQRVVSLLVRALSERGALVVARSEVARVRAMGVSAEEVAPGITVFRA